MCFFVFFFKQKTAYEMRISDWSSDVCSSDLDVASAGAGNAQGDAGTAPSRTNLDNLKQTSAIGTATARMIGDRNYLVTAGAILPCTLQTAMDSTVPGYATCIIPRAVYSDNGRVVLLEQGTRVFGQTQGGLQRGPNRLFAMWTRPVPPRRGTTYNDP